LQKDHLRHASWQDLVSSPGSASHIVQIFDDDDFLASAVALFAAEGLQRGEAVLLTGTEAHLRAVQRELRARDIDCDAAARSGQLSTSDVRQDVEAVIAGGMPNAARFEAIAGAALKRARADGRFSGVRWWGEMSSFLHQQGDAKACLALEELGAATASKYRATIFCSFLYDRFDPRGYDGILRDMCCRHTHVIPTKDYVRYRLAVNRAIAEIIGDIKGPLLQSLLSWKGLTCDLPSSQALLFWVRDALPEQFHSVLARAKAYA
jgi:hypothetical protein